jgi:sugar phosphate isomerase/epimerase
MKKYFLIFFWTAVFFSENRTLLAQNEKALYTDALGVESYTFRNSFPKDVAKTLDTIKMLGFTELEGAPNGLSPATFKKMCDERGIRIPSIGASYEQLVRSTDSVADNAEKLGAKYVMCAWIPHDHGVLTIANAKQAVIDFNRIGKTLRTSGLIFCYHAHGYEFQPYQNGNLLDYIFQHTNPNSVFFEMDIFWMEFGGGDPVVLLKKYGNRWRLIHLKDLRKGTKKDLTGLTSPDNDVPLGTGEIDIPGIIKEAKKIGIHHYFIEDESNHVMEQLPLSIQYVKGLKE